MEKPWNKSILQIALVVVLAGALSIGIDGIAAQKGKGKKASVCPVAELGSCPSHGCAEPGTEEALVNQFKRTKPPVGSPILLTVDDFDRLQDQADVLVGQKKKLNETARKKLQKLRLRSSKELVKEGDLVQVVGYIVGLPHRPSASGPESVNCRLRGRDNNDFHIPIALDPEDSEFEAIVVEMIPQDRPAGWTVPKLKRVARQKLPMAVRGQLFYDNMHVVNSDPDQVKSNQPKRFSLWEIHPVSEFHVCTRMEKKCDPKDMTRWEPLEKVEN